jgi:hypothetical protein
VQTGLNASSSASTAVEKDDKKQGGGGQEVSKIQLSLFEQQLRDAKEESEALTRSNEQLSQVCFTPLVFF